MHVWQMHSGVNSKCEANYRSWHNLQPNVHCPSFREGERARARAREGERERERFIDAWYGVSIQNNIVATNNSDEVYANLLLSGKVSTHSICWAISIHNQWGTMAHNIAHAVDQQSHVLPLHPASLAVIVPLLGRAFAIELPTTGPTAARSARSAASCATMRC